MLKLTLFVAVVAVFGLAHAEKSRLPTQAHNFAVHKLNSGTQYSVELKGHNLLVDPSHTFCTNPEPEPTPDQCGDPDPVAPTLGTCFQCAFSGQVELAQGEPNPSQADHTKVLECLFSLFNNFSPTRDWIVTSLNPSESGTAVADQGLVDLRNATYYPDPKINQGKGFARSGYTCSNEAVVQLRCETCRPSDPLAASHTGTMDGLNPSDISGDGSDGGNQFDWKHHKGGHGVSLEGADHH